MPYSDEALRENPPEKPNIPAIMRTLFADQPRVTRFPIDFDSDALPQQAETAFEDITQDHDNFMDVDAAKDVDIHELIMMKPECT
jgi:histone chaperone ASF1